MTGGGSTWCLVQLEFKRVQTYLFAVSELKSMIGANTLLGEVLRGRMVGPSGQTGFARCVTKTDENNLEIASAIPADGPLDADNLPALAVQCGASLPQGVDVKTLAPSAKLRSLTDPLSGKDCDDPAANYACGVLARDGGHLNAVFPSGEAAARFLHAAQRLVACKLPGLLVDWRAYELVRQHGRWVLPKDDKGRPQPCELPDIETADAAASNPPCGETPFHLPQFQVCDATGLVPATEEKGTPDNVRQWLSASVAKKREAAQRFAEGRSYDVLGVLRDAILGSLGVAQSKKAEALATEFERVAPSGYLAVIAADGNEVGDRTREIEKQAGDKGCGFFETQARVERFHHANRLLVRRALLDAIKETFSGVAQRLPLPFRPMMLGGDDLLLVCDAAFAVPFLIAFEKAIAEWDQVLCEQNAGRAPFTFGAGIAIVKRTFPFHRAHDLAEQLLSSAKRLYREQCRGSEAAAARSPAERVSTVDWLAISEAWHDELKDVRRRDCCIQYGVGGNVETLVLSQKPYPIAKTSDGGAASLEALWELAESSHGVARTQMNALARMLPQGRRQAEWAAQAVNDDALPRLLKKLHATASPWVKTGSDMWVSRFLDLLELRELARRREALISQGTTP